MKILIFETNIVFANLVKRILQETWRNLDVEIVNRHAVLCERLLENKYFFIIADVLSSQNMEATLHELRKARNNGTIIFTWAITNKDRPKHMERTVALFKKPAPTPENLRVILSQFMTSSGEYPAILGNEKGRDLRGLTSKN